MKSLIVFGMSCLLSFQAWADTSAGEKLAPVPKDIAGCVSAIADQRYCVETILDKYLAFDQWPAYTDTVGSDAIVFNNSARLNDLTNNDGSVVARHYYDYKLKTPIGYQKVRGVTYNHRLAKPYAGSEGTIEFVAQTSGPQEVPAGEKPLNGAEGLKLQTGIINAISCTNTELCGEGQWLLVYESSITPAITLLPKVAAASIEKGLVTVLIGMLFN
jgi:hypothetical protein